jgi:rRNA processing protein Gar1
MVCSAFTIVLSSCIPPNTRIRLTSLLIFLIRHIGSLLCFQEGIVLGKICEIFGPITTPFYVVKWVTLPASTSSKINILSKNKEESSSNKKKKNKRGSGHSKAVKKEELASIDDNSLEQAEDNGDTLQEKVISMDEKENADSADLNAPNQTVPVDAVDAMVVTEIAVTEQVISEESEEIVAVEETVQLATTTSTAQAEYFAILMSRALPGTAGETRRMISCHHPAHILSRHPSSHIPYFTTAVLHLLAVARTHSFCLHSTIAASTCTSSSYAILTITLHAVYSAAKHTVVITASSLSALRKQNKGTDASNIYDEEVSKFLHLSI